MADSQIWFWKIIKKTFGQVGNIRKVGLEARLPTTNMSIRNIVTTVLIVLYCKFNIYLKYTLQKYQGK